MIGWIPVLGPLALIVLPALDTQTLGLLATRAVVGAVQDRHLDGWVWTAVSWLLSPLGTALGRPFSHLVADSSAPVFLSLLGALYRAR